MSPSYVSGRSTHIVVSFQNKLNLVVSEKVDIGTKKCKENGLFLKSHLINFDFRAQHIYCNLMALFDCVGRVKSNF